MACEICGRGSCTRSFHSLDAQRRHDEKAGMSEQVDDLREEILDLRAEVERLRSDMRDAIGAIRGGSSGSAIVMLKTALAAGGE